MKTCTLKPVYNVAEYYQLVVIDLTNQGVRESTVGYHTVCKECENFNQAVTVAYNSEARTPKQVALLEQAKVLYETLHARGLAPKGRYAADVLGLTKEVKKTSVDRYLAAVMGIDG